jgi:hypothetical protein
MSSYLNINELAQSPAFRGRVQAALAGYASSVLSEEDKPAAQAAKRRQLAEAVLIDPAPKVNAVIWTIVTNTAIRAKGMDADDGELEYVVGQTWDRLAGVTTADREVADS